MMYCVLLSQRPRGQPAPQLAPFYGNKHDVDKARGQLRHSRASFLSYRGVLVNFPLRRSRLVVPGVGGYGGRVHGTESIPWPRPILSDISAPPVGRCTYVAEAS